MRRFAGVCFVVLAAACSGDDGGGGGVEMTAAQAFSPETVTVSVGDTVTWDNGSSEQHTVTAEESALPDGVDYFASGGPSSEDAANDDVSAGFIGPGDSYAYTFEEPGTYRYYCIPHREAGMTGTVVVEDA